MAKKDDKQNIEETVRGIRFSTNEYVRSVVRKAGLHQPFTDEDIDAYAWYILRSCLDGDRAQRQAILKRAGELEKIVARIAKSRREGFAVYIDMVRKIHDIKGDNEEACLRQAFKIMRKNRDKEEFAHLPDETLVTYYYRDRKPVTIKQPGLLPGQRRKAKKYR